MHSLASLRRFATATLLAASLLPATVSAQIPEGWGVAAGFYLVDDALQAFSPRQRGPGTSITGVPDEVRLVIGVSNGANSVAILPDGRVAVGNFAGLDGRPVVVHVLELNGFAVARSQRFEIGRSFSSNGSVNALQALDDGRLLYCTQSIYPGPANVGVIDPAAGTVLGLGISGLPSRDVNALAVSDDQTEVYLGFWSSATSGSVYRAPITGGVAQFVAATPHGATGLDVDNDGNLLVAMNNAAAGLAGLDLGTGILTPVAGSPRNVNAVACERTSGAAVYVHAQFPSSPSTVDHLLPGAASPNSIADLTGGRLGGLDFRESPRTYGRGAPQAGSYTWQTRPSPGGLPLLGNLGFSLTLDTAPAASPNVGLLLVSVARAQTPFQGVDILVGVGSAAITPLPIGTPRTTIPFPIPADPNLAGIRLHAQALFAEAGGTLATSAGLTFGPVMP